MTAVYGYTEALNYSFKDEPLFCETQKMWKPAPGSITDILQNHPFINILKIGGYEAMLGGLDNYFTLFVPIEVPQAKDVDVLRAKNMVRFSTLSTKAGIKLIKQRSFLVPMLGGRRINVYNEYGTVFLNDIDNPVRVVRPDIYASNGIIHFIDKPLEPWPS